MLDCKGVVKITFLMVGFFKLLNNPGSYNPGDENQNWPT
jgi:hypothetical protein